LLGVVARPALDTSLAKCAAAAAPPFVGVWGGAAIAVTPRAGLEAGVVVADGKVVVAVVLVACNMLTERAGCRGESAQRAMCTDGCGV